MAARLMERFAAMRTRWSIHGLGVPSSRVSLQRLG